MILNANSADIKQLSRKTGQSWFYLVCVFSLVDGGMVWLWGANHSGQSGLENVDISSKPNLLSSSVELR